MSDNLWPDFNAGQAPRSPKSIIEEAGSGLGEKTNGSVKFYKLRSLMKDDYFAISFSFYSPSLAYHFPFMTAAFPVQSYYPVTLTVDKLDRIVANNEAELIESLRTVFNAPTTVGTIERLMALAQ